MSLVQEWYDRVPAAAQSIALSLYGLKLLRQRRGPVYRTELSRLLCKDMSNVEQELAEQEAGIADIVGYAAAHSPFYARLYKGIDLRGVRTPADLTRLPIVAKETLRREIGEVRTIAPGRGVRSFTGGTTGKSLEVVFTPSDLQRRMAFLDAFKIRCGVDPRRSRKATFSGRRIIPPSQSHGRLWRTNWPNRQRLYSTFHLSAATLDSYVADLCAWRPTEVNGFVSAIATVARHMLVTGQRLPQPPLAVFTTSETLLPHHRADIEAAFGARVFDQYASAEGAPFVTECTLGSLHYHLDTGVIEAWEGPDGPEVLVTSFTSHGTPLIRYRIGDRMDFSADSCPCGSAHPVVSRIHGRAVDYLDASDGRQVSLSHLSDVVKGLPNVVKGVQFIQEAKGVVRALVVPDQTTDHAAIASKVAENLRYRFGGLVQVRVEIVGEIPPTPGGKRPLVIKYAPDVSPRS